MKQYYTDKDILDMIESKEVTELVRERFWHKDSRIDHLQTRVNTAAEHIGHQLLDELVEERY